MRRLLTIVLALALITGAVWLVLDRPVRDDRETPAALPEPEVIEKPTLTESEAPTVTEREATAVTGDAEPPPPDPDAWEVVEHDDFVPMREFRRRCKTVRNFLGAGEGDDVTTCERRFEIDHPYALFTDAQLEQIAQTDGEAAFILAHRQLFPTEPGATQDIEAGVNNVLSAMIRGAEGEALDLLLDESVFSPHTDLRSFLLWSMVGERLDIASPEQIERMLKFKDVTTIEDIEAIERNADDIASLLRRQRLIVLGTEF